MKILSSIKNKKSKKKPFSTTTCRTTVEKNQRTVNKCIEWRRPPLPLVYFFVRRQIQ